MMRRPSVGDRWQNRKTSRVCVIEVVEGGPDTALIRVGYRYEQRTPKSKATRRQWTSMPYLNVAFMLFEEARR